MIGIIDYGSGNVGAIANIYKQMRIPHFVSGDPGVLATAARFVLPGVGAFDTTMRQLRSSGVLEMLEKEVREDGKPLLGICVGMQVLAESSDEGADAGLGWIPGRVRKIANSEDRRDVLLPHMGWNSVAIRGDSSLFDGVDSERGFYFLHSYYFAAANDEDVVATTEYSFAFPCAVSSGRIYGLQFHPEKSHANGMAIFRNFAQG